MDEINRLYFIVGFLLGILLMGSIFVGVGLVYHEWVQTNNKNNIEEE